MNTTNFDFHSFCRKVKSFHGYTAPGVLLGGFMVNLARSAIPKKVLFNAICESASCLPDAIQLLTPCTIGNGWLTVFDYGRYALTLYDKKTGNGFRVCLSPERVREQSEIAAWFFKLKSKQEQNENLLLRQIKEGGDKLCSMHPVSVKPEFLSRHSKGKIVICPSCHEAYPARDGGVCRACQGQSPYVIAADAQDSYRDSEAMVF